MAQFSMTYQQQQAVDSRGGSLLVSAAAGSGKTRVLVERLLTLVEEEHADITRFLVITYTKAAAGELRSRIAKELAARLRSDPSNGFLRRQLALLYAAQISTIHAYCARLLRENTHRLDLDPNLRQLEDAEASAMQTEALEQLLEQRYADPEPGFAQLSAMLGGGSYDDRKLAEVVLDIHRRIQSHPNPKGWLAEQSAQFSVAAPIEQTAWGRLLMEKALARIRHAVTFAARAVDIAEDDALLNEKCAPQLREGLTILETICAIENPDWDSLRDAVLSFAYPRFKIIKKDEVPLERDGMVALRDLAKDEMKKAAKLLRDDAANASAAIGVTAPAMTALYTLVADFDDAFSAEKHRQGTVDFGDLEHLALKLLVENGTPTSLALREQTRFVEVMVDEYQDTNAVQNAIFTAISADGDRLFMVGDVKQSIYRFRLAEPEIFLAKSKRFPAYEATTQTGPRKVVLGQNFRSRSEVLDATNEVFQTIMTPDCGGLHYDAEAWLNQGATQENRSDCATEFALIDTLADEDEDSTDPKTSPYLIESRYIAARIADLMAEGMPVGAGESRRPLRYGDVAILRHSLSSTLRHLTQALDERGIPWSTDGGEEFFGAPEVEVALCFLQIIDNPRQDIPLISVLRSPVYAFSADRLARLRIAHPQGEFYETVCAAADRGEADCTAFLDDLQTLRTQATQFPVHAFVWNLFDRTNLLGLFGVTQSGPLRQRRLLTLAEAAQDFETAAGRGLFAFLTHLEALREKGEKLGQAPHSGGDCVQIKTIHKSKGLEFPVVFLAGMGGQINLADAKEPMLFHPKLGAGPRGFDPARRLRYPTLARDAVQQTLNSETKSEAMRLLYVGMTRAEKKLIMTCTMKDAASGLAKLAMACALPLSPQTVENQNCTGKWIALAALMRPEGGQLRSLANWDVPIDRSLIGVPWQINVISGTNYERVPTISTSPYIEKPETAAITAEELLTRYLWQYPQTAADVPSKLTATSLKNRFLDAEVQEDAPKALLPDMVFDPPVFLQGERPLTAAQKGSALHLAMQFFDYSKTENMTDIENELEKLKAMEILTPEQVAVIDGIRILRLFESDLGRALRQNPTLRREFKFSLLVPAADYYNDIDENEQVLLQGVVDAFFETDEGLTVVDFKTDRVTPDTIAARAEEYRPQLDAYARALSTITGKPIARRILWFFSINQPFSL